MDDDNNTANAESAVYEIIREANAGTDEHSSKQYVDYLLEVIHKLVDGVLGVKTDRKTEILDEDIEKLIEERQAARKSKDFARADAIREQPLFHGHSPGGYQRGRKVEESIREEKAPAPAGAFFEISRKDELGGLSLAYIGDAVFELMVRLYMAEHGSIRVEKLHKRVTETVNAGTQSRYFLGTASLRRRRRSFAGAGTSGPRPRAKHQGITDYRRPRAWRLCLAGCIYKEGWKDSESFLLMGMEGLSKEVGHEGQ